MRPVPKVSLDDLYDQGEEWVAQINENELLINAEIIELPR